MSHNLILVSLLFIAQSLLTFLIFNFLSFYIKENVKKRGVDDKDLLPNYYYRDAGLLIWDAIESYVREIIGIFYKSDDDVKDDTEVHSWANNVLSHIPRI